MSENIKISKIPLIIFWGITASLFGYVFLRAYHIGFTHDESLTYTILVGRKEWILTANNHWLNTILSYLSAKIFGYSELPLRLANVCSFLVYSYFCYKLVVEKATYVLAAMLSVVFLMFNPYLIEFFGLSRGYGLATAFFIGSLFYFIKTVENPVDFKTLIKALLLSVLTIYCNYAFIIPISSMQLGYFVCLFFKKRKQLLCRNVLLYFIFEICALIPAFVNILVLKMKNQLYYGGSRNIIEDTLFSVFSRTFQIKLFGNQHQNWIVLFLITASVLCGILIKRKKDSLKYLLIVLFTTLFLSIFLHYTFRVKYALDRAALYWVVMLGTYFSLFLENLVGRGKRTSSYFFTAIIGGLSILVLLSFFRTMNITYTQQWRYDANTCSMLETLNREVGQSRSNKKYLLGINWLFEPTINYYRKIKRYNWLEPVTRKGIHNHEYDFYYIFKNHRLNIPCQKEIKSFRISNTILIKNCSSDGSIQVCKKFKDRKALCAIQPMHQVSFSSVPNGLLIQSDGIDPQILLPPINCTHAGQPVLKIVMKSSVKTALQVFYLMPDEKRYARKYSVRANVAGGDNVLFVKIPRKALSKPLRLDPGQRPGRYLLRSIDVMLVSQKHSEKEG